jgi:signal peptidase I
MDEQKPTADESSHSRDLSDLENVPEKKAGLLKSVFGFESYRSFGLVILAIVIFRSSIMSPYHVPTGSMEPTIKIGDRLLAWKLAYELKFPIPFTEIDLQLFSWGAPDYGDIIVFRYPKDLSIDYVKRVVAKAGDEILIKENILYVNGQPLEQTSVKDEQVMKDLQLEDSDKELYREKLKGEEHWVLRNPPSPMSFFSNADWPGTEEPYVVPEDSVFVMGDNRDNSQDSRIWGEVPIDYVRGKALFVIWSVYQAKDDTWPKLRFDRMGHWL